MSSVSSNKLLKYLRLEAWFSGHVQGVGFRFQALQVAKGFIVTGFVQNLSDGRVYLVAEGSADEVKAFLEALAKDMKTFVRQVKTKEESVGHLQYEGFVIAH